MATPALPPRRQIPPPPRRWLAPAQVQATEGASAPQTTVAARIAGLQLDSQPQPPHRSNRAALSIAERNNPKPALVHIKAPPETSALLLAGLDPDYFSWLLTRPPPPIPGRSIQPIEEKPPRVPPRRVPPRPPPQPGYELTADGVGEALKPGAHHYHAQEIGSHDVDDAPDTATSPEELFSGGLYSPGTCIKCHDFSGVDTHAAQFPRQNVRSLDELAESLTQPFVYETEKARAIFTWLHHNIRYDTQSFFAGTVKPATPQSTLSSGLAVCDGFAGLFVYLAQQAGLQVHKVSGHGKGFGYRELAPGEPVPEMSQNHAWNCVFMDGGWRLLDATWGAGAVNGSDYQQRFDPSWFSLSPTEFGRRHFPADPTFQLVSDEGELVEWEEYILRPQGPVIYNDFYQLDFSLDHLQPASSTIENGQMVAFTLFKRCEHMSTGDADNYVYILHFPDQKPVPLLHNAEGGWGITHRIYNQAEVSLLFVSTVDGRDAKGIGVRGFNSALDRKPMTFGGLVKWTVT